MSINLAYRALTDPDSVQVKTDTSDKINGYRLAWAYYKRRAFASEAEWAWLTSREQLYEHTKLIFNVVPGIVDFYVDNIWSSAKDEANLSLVTPVAPGADADLTAAIGQIDQWVNWWSEQQIIKQYTAATGTCLVEIVDDEFRGKIGQNTVWAGFIKDVQLNQAGDVESYTVEHPVYDPALKENYIFRREINKYTFSYFRDDRPFPYLGSEPVVDNLYGFCPAVLFRHSGGGAFGDAAFTDYVKINHANALASHLHDNIHKEIESGKWLGLESPEFTIISGAAKNRDGTIRESDTRLERLLIASKGGATVNDLSGQLKLAEAHPYLKDLLISFADDYPELEYRQIIKANAQLSGIALERLLTPAQNRLDAAAPNYDGQLIKLRQMQIAVAGWRTRGGGWRNLSEQQRKFTPFDLSSYERGDLDFNLKRSVLIEESASEREQMRAIRFDNANKATFVTQAEQLKIAGYSDDEIAEMMPKIIAENPVLDAARFAADNGQTVKALPAAI